ncbi:heme-binding protein [Terrimonas sp. NA20]|uniref:Heme-binding protein n=1 Tax=Terrimonas ginsenosidimutans TaxID=2908004 RepID=A0ABS9KME5_9BACT|nr:heme-binding protein [Terrimonas ginsenosidimutans]MCG2613495.1 heme-binding protein [Terrimonas ginsenosidimutans]
MNITNNQASKALYQAIDKANEIGVSANITILDTAGHLKLFARMDDAFLGSIDISMGKAKTAMLFRMNSEKVGEFLAPEMGTYGMLQTSGGLVGFKGGMPVTTGTEILAYIGVSGGSPDQDFEIAKAGSTI